MIKHLYSNFPSIYIGFILLLGLIPQSGDHPLILIPFLLLTASLVLGNHLVKLSTKDSILFILLGLWLIWGISGILSPVPFPSKVTWLIFATLPLTYMVCTTTKCDLTISLIILATPLAIYTLYQSITGTNRPDFPFDDTNLLGLLMAIAAITATKYSPAKYLIPLFILALILTESRTALLSLVIGLLVMAFTTTNILSKIRDWKKPIWGIISLTIITAISLLFLTGFNDRIAATITDSSLRFIMWESAWHMSWQNPLTGLGLGTFHLHYPPYRIAGDESLGWMVHMEPLQMAVESGWPSAFLLYGLFLWGGLKLRYNPVSLSILSIIFTAMHLTYPLHSLPFLIITGYCLAQYQTNKTYERPTLIFPLTLLTTLLCTTILALSITYTFLIWGKIQTSIHAHNQKIFDSAMDECLKKADTDFPDCKIMTARFLSLSQTSSQVQIDSLLDQANHNNPLNAEIPFLRAQSRFLKDPSSGEELLPLLKQSLDLNPLFWPSRKMTINIYLNMGKWGQAKQTLEEGIKYPYPASIRQEFLSLKKQISQSSNQPPKNEH